MLEPVIFLLLSILVLAKSSETAVDNAARLSRYFGISQLAIGMIFMAVMTSLPELVVGIISGSLGEGAISAGNVFGSNIANILLVLGLGAFLYGMRIPRESVGEVGLILMLTTVLFAYIMFSSQVQGRALGFPAGIMLLGFFTTYVIMLVKGRKKVADSANNQKVDKKKALNALLLFVGSTIIVLLSSAFVVENAVITAEVFGVAQSLIGATVIAVGTSLPELSTTLQALRKKRYSMAVGNVVGSNMTNLTLVLGATAVLNEIHVMLPVFTAAMLFAIVANAILLYIAAARRDFGRYSGLLLLAVYAVFIITILGVQAAEIAV